jgi:hypothetical protein
MSGAPDSPALPQNTVSDALVVRRTWWAHWVPRAHRAEAALMILCNATAGSLAGWEGSSCSSTEPANGDMIEEAAHWDGLTVSARGEVQLFACAISRLAPKSGRLSFDRRVKTTACGNARSFCRVRRIYRT